MELIKDKKFFNKSIYSLNIIELKIIKTYYKKLQHTKPSQRSPITTF